MTLQVKLGQFQLDHVEPWPSFLPPSAPHQDILAHNVDSLYLRGELAFDGEDGERRFVAISDMVMGARSTPDGCTVVLELGGNHHTFELTASGARPIWAWVARGEAGDLAVSFHHRVIQFKASSELCWRAGPAYVTELTRALGHALGASAVSITVTRIDMCVDVRPRKRGWRPRRLEHWVSRTANRAEQFAPSATSQEFRVRSRFTGLRFGSGDVVVAIYDKAAEARSKNTLPRWLEHWGLSELPVKATGETRSVWRIEVRLRGQAVRQFLAETQDVARHAEDKPPHLVSMRDVDAMATYAGQAWSRVMDSTRMTVGKQTRVKRRDVCPLWLSLTGDPCQRARIHLARSAPASMPCAPSSIGARLAHVEQITSETGRRISVAAAQLRRARSEPMGVERVNMVELDRVLDRVRALSPEELTALSAVVAELDVEGGRAGRLSRERWLATEDARAMGVRGAGEPQ